MVPLVPIWVWYCVHNLPLKKVIFQMSGAGSCNPIEAWPETEFYENSFQVLGDDENSRLICPAFDHGNKASCAALREPAAWHPMTPLRVCFVYRHDESQVPNSKKLVRSASKESSANYLKQLLSNLVSFSPRGCEHCSSCTGRASHGGFQVVPD